ncbi:Uu.00g092440.m01.CDS01 [Anthostomella pinea]|uniref:Uu.00g092440.m01.CDS01 n=1 Tax=Anthostomella pinea TaxID=933095 RepID=A0AAI8YKL2_9PEZI|nr:Uu.00g092440.m01.CDS01 [Anthostomella pinea]
MPADEYASVGGGGALKLKGGKVQKSKKKKNKEKSSNLERSLSTGLDPTTSKELDKKAQRLHGDEEDAGKRHQSDDEEGTVEHKTEAERRHAEFARKKMLKMLDDPTLSSELRKTHKERVEGLNTYLSKLSEHHDMPKIGPG